MDAGVLNVKKESLGDELGDGGIKRKQRRLWRTERSEK